MRGKEKERERERERGGEERDREGEREVRLLTKVYVILTNEGTFTPPFLLLGNANHLKSFQKS